ncbi:hypothetical protein AVEN_20064-1 [Araneus ventricosus]|uniref:Uncharacterized protein n=1 Tax=Araneus ventricosus TaxID=182803 RepID=A0A4Y2JZI5_ARAVE|nr:hypothetical protein AVEN_20064-1 [Araneus ventricosus]
MEEHRARNGIFDLRDHLEQGLCADGYGLKWREIGDIAAEINGGEEDGEDDNDDEEDAAKVPPTHTVALEASETL